MINLTLELGLGASSRRALSIPPPVDGLSPTGAWSASRKLLSSYSGSFYTIASGGIDSLKDQSGNGRNLDQGIEANRPDEIIAGPSNRAAIDFSGVAGNRLQSTATLADFINNNSAWMVVSLIADAFTLAGTGALVDRIFSDSSLFFGITAGSGAPNQISGYNWDGSYDIRAATAVIDTPYVVSLRHEGGTLYFSINGGTEISVASGNTTGLAGTMQMGSGASSNAFNGKVFEAAIFDTVPDETTRNAIIANMMAHIGAS